MTRCYIAIGSNLASPLAQASAAIAALKTLPDSELVAHSSFWRTPPLGPQDQPDYLNAAVALETQLSPEALLDCTQRIELEQGRERKAERWGPRTLDLDIMLFGGLTLDTPRLTVPHYDMKNRMFMLWPLYEIAPTLYFPDGETLQNCIARLTDAPPKKW
ncbi:2-amino-4-hydroxy-6-hydroxymethyldihydropteridine diphosphokinase [Erwinia sp. HR93]|uniref:2-amino-4-hydroxy-6- hydroxymethyldihydropteridine diphosphokinase n=1 Tax=Erwinia sp. HR93 TaxID=3094840 RepID=UPI002ADED718|nr:2-amino-4-hydroxy-6-hydroxymethyldihydropteridine diphosphokinase [Erwinia sp. HR93]MEA1063640.1 2-amino-4-hydroxy-6-hydroxymethyldihydropteridine diphosphokinase [Erwinia sp. HR93]